MDYCGDFQGNICNIGELFTDMLLRFVCKNIFSFKEETEFNLFPARNQRLSHHKEMVNEVDFLRFGAIYGANGAGKSNLVKAIAFLEKIVAYGKITISSQSMAFKLLPENEQLPISFGIEFTDMRDIYYYTLTFQGRTILEESLSLVMKKKDSLVFQRTFADQTTQIEFNSSLPEFTGGSKATISVLEKILDPNQLLLSFLASKLPEEGKIAKRAVDWFDKSLVVIQPNAIPEHMPILLHENKAFAEFVKALMPTLKTGIEELVVEKQKLSERLPFDNYEMENLKTDLEKTPTQSTIFGHPETGEEVWVNLSNGELYAYTPETRHLNEKGEKIKFYLKNESDGTNRLIEYLPIFWQFQDFKKVFIIDEIERSIHPLMIKEIISKLSLDENALGQLIFTTHESYLLDQSILRPDEIWMAQKDVDGSSKFYPLSDFQIHHTLSIENGYLNGRFGGIPFLGSFHDLNWNSNGIPQPQ